MEEKCSMPCHLDVEDPLSRLFLAPHSNLILSPVERELILFGAYTVFGEEADVIEQGGKTIEAGAKPEALIEIALTATLSRGARAWRIASRFVSSLPPVSKRAGQSNLSSPCEYFASEFDPLPKWVLELNSFSPGSLRDYAILRSEILSDGIASRKVKELLTMLLNAVTGNASGIKSHASAAMRQGATKEAIYDVLLSGVRIGGIVTWINGINSLPGDI